MDVVTSTTLPQLDRFISLPQAARQLGVAKDALRLLIDSGRIKGAVLPNGEIGVSESNMQVMVINERLRSIKKSTYKHLKSHLVSIAEAAQKYDIPAMTIRSWMQRGIVSVLESGYGAKLDESDIAYCAAIYQIRKETGSLSGAPLLDETGQPYELKNLRLAEYRRKRKAVARKK